VHLRYHRSEEGEKVTAALRVGLFRVGGGTPTFLGGLQPSPLDRVQGSTSWVRCSNRVVRHVCTLTAIQSIAACASCRSSSAQRVLEDGIYIKTKFRQVRCRRFGYGGICWRPAGASEFIARYARTLRSKLRSNRQPKKGQNSYVGDQDNNSSPRRTSRGRGLGRAR
jgi:hypothetical protein